MDDRAAAAADVMQRRMTTAISRARSASEGWRRLAEAHRSPRTHHLHRTARLHHQTALRGPWRPDNATALADDDTPPLDTTEILERFHAAVDDSDTAARALAEIGEPEREASSELADLAAARLEAAGKRERVVHGYASITGVAYELWDGLGPYYEIISADSFARSIAAAAAGRSDLLLKVNHDGLGLASISGDTLTILEDETGLGFAATVDTAETDAADLVRKLKRGSTSHQTSMAGRIRGWAWDDTWTVLTISDWDLHRGDVAAVAAGANPWGWITANGDLTPPAAAANDDPTIPDADRNRNRTQPPYRPRNR